VSAAKPAAAAAAAAPTNNGPPAKPAAAGGAVIRRVGGVEETAAERLVTRHLPAWVVSGLVHLGVIFLAWLLFSGVAPDAKKTDKILATTVEKEPEEPVKDLTNEDPGFESNIASALPEIDKLAEKTADALTSDDPIGVPDSATADTAALKAPGLPTTDSATAGVTGTEGAFKGGESGSMGNLSAAFLGRSGGTKSRLLKEGGGNDASEQAVARALAWLARQQKGNGSWEFDAADPKQRKKDLTTSTGLALLPFLAAGQTHKIQCKYQKTVRDGLGFLVANLNLSTGKFNFGSPQYMYGHAISAMALCEAYGMTKDPNLKRAAQAATTFIVVHQGANGSWGYAPDTQGDTSIVGWQVQALRAAQLSKDLIVPDACVRKAMKFLDEVSSGSRKAVYGYATKGGAPGTSLTAVGLLCRYYMDGWGPGNAGMAEGVPGLFGTPKPGAKDGEPQTNRQRAPKTLAQAKANGTMPDMYYYYYATQVVHFFEGPEWKEWNEGPKGENGARLGGMRDWLVELQNKKDANLTGSWEPSAGTIGSHCGRLGTTCLCLLTLEVYYRHLPLYKRDQGGAAILDAVR
jgi:hypothetical protein